MITNINKHMILFKKEFILELRGVVSLDFGTPLDFESLCIFFPKKV